MVESSLIIWLSDQIDRDNDNVLDLHTLISHDNLRVFSNRDECINFLTDIREISMRIDLIISLSLLNETSKTLIDVTADLSNINSIYILCPTASSSTNSYAKLRGIHNNYQSLIDQLLSKRNHELHRYKRFASDDFVATSMMPLTTVTTPSSRLNTDIHTSTKKQEAEFMYSHLAGEILISMESTKMEMVEYCRHQYADDENQLRLIQEFEQSYESHKAIFWYTRDTFLYRLLNKALREQDIDILYSLRYFIKHLHLQLNDFHSKQVSTNSLANGEVLRLYRGQLIKTDEFEYKIRYNIGGFLSVTNFLSTTKLKHLATIFSGNGTQVNMQSILFQIDIDPSVKKFPYANICTESVFGEDEEEVLFTMGAVFRILSVESIGTNIWHVSLSLTGEEDEELRNLINYMRIGLGSFTPEIHLARLLFELAQYDKAICYLNKVMQDSQLMKDPITCLYVYNELGDIYNAMKDTEKSEEYYNKALEIDLGDLPEHHLALMIVNSIKARAYQRNGDVEQTLFYYNKALEISLKYPEEYKYCNVEHDYGNIAAIYMKQERYAEAMEMCQRALEFQIATMPPNHPSFATTYQHMSKILSKQEKYEQAHEYLEKALEIQQTSVPVDHPDFISIYEDLTISYFKLDKHKESLECMQKLNQLRLKQLEIIRHENTDAASNQYRSRIEETRKLLEILREKEAKGISTSGNQPK